MMIGRYKISLGGFIISIFNTVRRYFWVRSLIRQNTVFKVTKNGRHYKYSDISIWEQDSYNGEYGDWRDMNKFERKRYAKRMGWR